MGIFNTSASFTRPADTTAYAAGDLVANSTTAGSVTPLTFPMQSSNVLSQFNMRRVRLFKSNTSVTNASFRVHFYATSPAVANGDNGAFSSTKAADYLGYVNVDLTTTPGAKFSDGASGVGSPAAGADFNIRAAGVSVYALIEAVAAYTPASGETFTLTVEAGE